MHRDCSPSSPNRSLSRTTGWDLFIFITIWVPICRRCDSLLFAPVPCVCVCVLRTLCTDTKPNVYFRVLRHRRRTSEQERHRCLRCLFRLIPRRKTRCSTFSPIEDSERSLFFPISVARICSERGALEHSLGRVEYPSRNAFCSMHGHICAVYISTASVYRSNDGPYSICAASSVGISSPLAHPFSGVCVCAVPVSHAILHFGPYRKAPKIVRTVLKITISPGSQAKPHVMLATKQISHSRPAMQCTRERPRAYFDAADARTRT